MNRKQFIICEQCEQKKPLNSSSAICLDCMLWWVPSYLQRKGVSK